MALCASIWAGAWMGLRLLGDVDADRGVLALVAAHLFAATIFIVGMGMGIGAMCNRRLTAAVICFVIIFYSFVLNILGAFWPAVPEAMKPVWLWERVYYLEF